MKKQILLALLFVISFTSFAQNFKVISIKGGSLFSKEKNRDAKIGDELSAASQVKFPNKDVVMYGLMDGEVRTLTIDHQSIATEFKKIDVFIAINKVLLKKDTRDFNVSSTSLSLEGIFKGVLEEQGQMFGDNISTILILPNMKMSLPQKYDVKKIIFKYNKEEIKAQTEKDALILGNYILKGDTTQKTNKIVLMCPPHKSIIFKPIIANMNDIKPTLKILIDMKEKREQKIKMIKQYLNERYGYIDKNSVEIWLKENMNF